MTDGNRTAPRRLHLGASRLEKLPAPVAAVFADETWVNLGDPPPTRWEATALAGIGRHARNHGWITVPAQVFRAVRSRGDASPAVPEPAHFRVWRYEKGDRLDFAAGGMTFVFSEHFFEHLWFDEAAALMRECARVLAPGGIVRTVVPDADLRTDLPPEPLGYPGRRVPWTDPAKHKTRWSVYMLNELLEQSGLVPVPVRWYDKHATLTELSPDQITAAHTTAGAATDDEMPARLDYVSRMNSLIVDGVKVIG